MIWTCISPMISESEHLFLYLLAACTSSLEKCLFRHLAHFNLGSWSFYWVMRVVVIFGYTSLTRLLRAHIFSLFLACLFPPLMVVLAAQKVEFWWSPTCGLFLLLPVLWVLYFRSAFPHLRPQRPTPIFSPKNYIGLALIPRSVTHCD